MAHASLIKKIHAEFKATGRLVIPDRLLPAAQGCNLIAWVRELYAYYQDEGVVVRAFDELPPLRLSQQPELETTLQDIHRFIVSDMNLIPLEVRKAAVGYAISAASPCDAWQQIMPLLREQLDFDRATVHDELSWKFSPVAEVLWALTWFFMEREEVVPPRAVAMASVRFPYYLWVAEGHTQSFWEPEHPLCRWEWLAMDLYEEVLRNEC